MRDQWPSALPSETIEINGFTRRPDWEEPRGCSMKFVCIVMISLPADE